MLNANINKTNSHPSKNLKSHEESEAPTYLIIQKHSCVPRVLRNSEAGLHIAYTLGAGHAHRQLQSILEHNLCFIPYEWCPWPLKQIRENVTVLVAGDCF